MSSITTQRQTTSPHGIALSKEQRHRIGLVRELVQGEFKARGKDLLDGSFPWENMRKLADIGVLGMAVAAAGAAGLPVFAPMGAPGVARFFGPTGGYLIAYPAAAFVAGALGRRAPSLLGRWLAATAGSAVILLGGVAELTIINGSLTRAVAIGLTPFALLDIVKAFVAAVIAGRRIPLSGRRAGD